VSTSSTAPSYTVFPYSLNLHNQNYNHNNKQANNVRTLILKPPSITPFICSTARDAASGMSYSRKAKPLCFLRTVSYGRLSDLIGPNGKNACFTTSSWIPKLIEPMYILYKQYSKNLSIDKSIKAHLHRAIRHKRIRGA